MKLNRIAAALLTLGAAGAVHAQAKISDDVVKVGGGQKGVDQPPRQETGLLLFDLVEGGEDQRVVGGHCVSAARMR